MMEHVGPKNHRDMMEVIDRCLVDDGVALVHTIANNRSLRHGTPFIEKYIFPNAVAPSLAQIGRAMEGLFVLEDLHNIGPDYDPTLMAWWENFDRTYREICAPLRPPLLPDVEVLPARGGGCVARARRPALPARDDQDRPQAARLPHELRFSSGGIGGTNGARAEG